MGIILPQKIKVFCDGNVVKYYENLGYQIPKYYNQRRKKYAVKRGTTIEVNADDLPPKSNLIISCECDKCGRKEDIEKNEYTRISSLLESCENFEYLCPECRYDVLPSFKINAGIMRNNIEEIRKFLIVKLSKYIEKYGYPLNKKKDFKSEKDMPSIKMYNTYLDGDLVDWIELCEFKLSEDEKYIIRHRGGKNKLKSKDECIDAIFKTQSDLNRPLKGSDFSGSNPYHVGMRAIEKYWGTLNNMKKELGLEIIQESMMPKQLTQKAFDEQISDIVNFVKKDNRNFISTREINQNHDWSIYNTLNNASKKYYNISLSNHLKSFGINFGKQGNGINFTFDDGEKVASQFEYMFSKFLKENNFVYNVDYFRDVKYKNFIQSYNGNMNCDYVVNSHRRTIYIEIAGIIADYKTWFYEDRVITYSKSKENYRLKLKEKEKMLKSNNLDYYILFPCDLTLQNFKNILFNEYPELRKEIEGFYKNNIDWKKVQKIGELDYTKDVIRDFSRGAA